MPGGHVELVPDDRGGVTLLLDGSPQSHVQLSDPGLLAFEYVAHLALVIDATAPPAPATLAVTHVGGAAMTLARWVEHTRPGSPQIVMEPDAALTELVRHELPLPRRHRIRVRPVDGLTGTAALADTSADVVVVDAFDHGQVPAELTTTAYLADVARVLRPTGVALLNLADEPGLRYVARVVASLAATGLLGEVALLATQEVLKGRRFGNVVVAASATPLDVSTLAARVARSPLPTGLRRGGDVERMARSARPLTVDDPRPSPPSPDPGRWRVR
ncbi:fused MFS/spermidine synthase [Dermatophilaceae bacterium Soc4.6]